MQKFNNTLEKLTLNKVVGDKFLNLLAGASQMNAERLVTRLRGLANRYNVEDFLSLQEYQQHKVLFKLVEFEAELVVVRTLGYEPRKNLINLQSVIQIQGETGMTKLLTKVVRRINEFKAAGTHYYSKYVSRCDAELDKLSLEYDLDEFLCLGAEAQSDILTRLENISTMLDNCPSPEVLNNGVSY